MKKWKFKCVVLTVCFFTFLFLLSGCGGGGGGETTQPPSQKYGTLSIVTDPQGAKIYLDSVEKGDSPLFLENISVETHKIKAAKNLYAATEQDAVVQENKTTTVTIVLNADTSTPNPPPFAK